MKNAPHGKLNRKPAPYSKRHKTAYRYSEAYQRWRNNPTTANAIAWARIFAPWTINEPRQRRAAA